MIHSQRRNKLNQQLVEKLVRDHTNLVLRESLDDALHHLLPWDIELVSVGVGYTPCPIMTPMPGSCSVGIVVPLPISALRKSLGQFTSSLC